MTETLGFVHDVNLGASVRGISPEGRCPVCGGTFKADHKRNTFVCPDHLTQPLRYTVYVRFKGDLIRRSTTLDGQTLRTHFDAQALVAQMRREIKLKRFDPAVWTSHVRAEFLFERLAWRWYHSKERLMLSGKRAPSYVPKLACYIRLYWLPYFQGRDIREIGSIRDFSDGLTVSPKYASNIVRALIGFFRWCHEERIIRELPALPKIELDETLPRVLTGEAQARILAEIPEEHRPIFVFLIAQGCRPSEARALKWSDIEGDVVTYRRTWSGRRLMERTKTRRQRANWLFPDTVACLPPKGLPNAFVFTHAGRPYSDDLLHRLYGDACRKLGIDVPLYQATKHSFGYRMLQSGINIYALKEWFGHTTISMTEKYARLEIADVFRDRFSERSATVQQIGKKASKNNNA